MRWLIRITVSLLLLALIGVGYQILGMMTDQEQYLQPRELVDIGAYKLHLSYRQEELLAVIPNSQLWMEQIHEAERRGIHSSKKKRHLAIFVFS